MLDTAAVEHLVQYLRVFDGDRADEHRAALLADFFYLFDHRLELGFLVLEYLVAGIFAHHRLVGGDDHHLQLVDLVELLGLGYGRAGHAGQLGIHAEVVLDGDGGEGLGLLLHLDVFLGLDGLVQALGVAPPDQQRPVNSSTMSTSPSLTTYWWSCL